MATWQPPTDDIRRVLHEQNPWLATGRVPDVLAPANERPLAELLWRHVAAGEPRRFHIVLGPRRVGKTTAMYQTVRHLISEGTAANQLWWLRLDHPLLCTIPLGTLVRVIIETAGAEPGREIVLFCDELVYAKDWELWLKTFYDEHWPVRLVGTASATAALRNRRRESGVGRWTEHYLLPYSFGEYLDLIGEAATERITVGDNLADTIRSLSPVPVFDERTVADQRRRFLLIGGFPELLDRHGRASAIAGSEQDGLLQSQLILRTDAVERAIYQDIPRSFGIDNPMLLERLLYVLAGQVTGIISPSSLCKDLDGMTQPTLDRYLSFLEHAYLIFRLTNYVGSEESIQKRGRKLFFLDSAVRNAALQRGLAPLSNPAELGLLQENMAAAALHALGQHSGLRVHYWRDSSKKEVDLIYNHPTQPLAFELASTSHHTLAGLEALRQAHKRFENRTYLVAPGLPLTHPEESSRGVGQISLDLFLLACSRQASAALSQQLPTTTR